MAGELEKIVDDMSLLLVMLDGSDEMGIDAIVSLCEQLKAKADQAGSHADLVQACTETLSLRQKLSSADFLQRFGAFLSGAQSYLNNSGGASLAAFSGNTPAAHPDLAPNLDETLIVAFIEKHGTLLEDFESAVVEFQFNSQHEAAVDAQKFQSQVKAYIHNLKGDAGSVGLLGIERAAHALEDLLVDLPAPAAVDELVAFKEWVSACIRSLTAKTEFKEQAAAFIARAIEPKCAGVKRPPSKKGKKSAAKASAPESTKPTPPKAGVETYEISADTEVLMEFAVEAEDHLNNVESILLEHSDTLSHEQIDTVYRAVHSVKGASSYFNLKEITETSHKLENTLDEVRDEKRVLDPGLVDLVFRYIDLQKKLIAEAKVAAGGTRLIERKPAVAAFLEQLEAYLSGTPTHTVSVSAAPDKAPVAAAEAAGLAPETAAEAAPPAPVPQAAQPARPASVESAKPQSGRLDIKTFVKVDTVRLDRLIESIGEMLIYSSMLVRSCRELLGDNEQLVKTTHQVEKFSRELQDIGMSMRLDPIKGLFQKMSRLVYDISRKIGKEVSFTMKGEDTEMDRTMIEKLADPLMHMVRNALDHGIEPPDERIKKGKPPTGNIELRAYQAGGSIQIEIIDDGRGLDPEKLRLKAVEKGLLSPDRKITDQEAYRLIFAPGFSTAAQITDISGRGVGMDVVRSNIESMRGHIFIQSEIGKGSTFRLELPLTLAIMDGIETLVGCERFIIPTLSVVEIIRPTPDMLCYPMEREETFKFRSEYLPLYRLAKLFDLKPKHDNPTEATVVVVENTGELVALMVDEILGNCQTVIKSLGAMFQDVNGLAGCAIMSNGDIGLIVDIRSTVQLARTGYDFARVTRRHDFEGALSS